MIEVMIDCWTKPEGGADYLWSVWHEGKRIQLGPHAYGDADICETEARDYCAKTLGCQPDRVTRL